MAGTLLSTLSLRKGDVRREQDVRQREVELAHLYLSDVWRAIDNRREQLKALSGLSGLAAGFAMVILVQTKLPPNLLEAASEPLVALFGALATVVVCLNLLSMILSACILIAILGF